MKILFLGYPDCQVLDSLRKEHDVFNTQKRLKDEFVEDYELLVSFGYRFLLSSSILRRLDRVPINLHISYLPWNRGADPNYWSFLENTPKGVSIHEIDEGIDTGSIIYQKIVNFMPYENTLALTYERLIEEVQDLFISNLESILMENYTAQMQLGHGSYHPITELNLVDGWDTNIASLQGVD